MLRHQLTLAFRSFMKFKKIFAINLFGLAIGLTTVVLIMMWVKDELSISRNHENIDRIYAVMTNHDNSGGIVTIGITPGDMAEAMKAELSQVELSAGTSSFIEGIAFENGDTKMTGAGLYVDQAYFDIFSVDFVEGNPNQIMTGINSLAISETMATKLFGSPKEALGKSVKWQVFDYHNDVEVTGVYKDFGSLEVDKPDYFLSFSYFKQMLGEGVHWGNFNASTYVLLRPDTDVAAFNEQIAGFIKAKDEGSNVSAFVQPYGDTYLYGTYEDGKIAGGRISYVKLFSAIAIFILIIACINFMNLTTARSISRLKEIGVKKSMGASRGGLFGQFMVESLLLTFMALVLAILATFILQPFFNQVTSKTLSMSFQPELILLLLGIWLLTSFLAGIYPAVYLSRFKPVEVMKSNIKGSFGELLARKGLVVFQFAISLLLIIGISVIGKQMTFIQNQNLGYNQSQLLQINASGVNPNQLDSFLAELKKSPGVENASSLSHPLVGLNSATIGLTWEGKNPEEQVKFENVSVNMGLIETMGFELVGGRAFSPEFGEEESKIILNEAAVRTIGFDDPVGQIVNLWGEDKEVVGVIKDFNFESLKETVKPAFLKYDPGFAQRLMVRIEPQNQQETIARIDALFVKQTAQPMDYSFMDEDYQSLYASEQRVSKLAKYFGVMAIFLSCLGLFGLAAFTAEKRKKEIGVRKVMGASTFSILTLVSKDFVQLILVSIVIAVPLAWYFANNWLKTYAYQTSLSWWIFAGSGFLLVLIAVITVGVQAFKAASANPVNSLKSE
ncbi:ABC-type transport system, involved in lipoprotein release, permease component [Algoriphagus aquimarinus]|uniref:ABC-type transport system, involved in lipoprotein release, permease component n=2 Tax=Algoriphagus aquimarinus TaxID=237018 RepID=A0A1I0XKD6_9BACT|nr:ABC-type transport system, involved in lipoprotein release, permease component [Algoriphagus aquimarinus]